MFEGALTFSDGNRALWSRDNHVICSACSDREIGLSSLSTQEQTTETSNCKGLNGYSNDSLLIIDLIWFQHLPQPHSDHLGPCSTGCPLLHRSRMGVLPFQDMVSRLSDLLIEHKWTCKRGGTRTRALKAWGCHNSFLAWCPFRQTFREDTLSMSL